MNNTSKYAAFEEKCVIAFLSIQQVQICGEVSQCNNTLTTSEFYTILFSKLYISFSEHRHLSLHLWLQFCRERERERVRPWSAVMLAVPTPFSLTVSLLLYFFLAAQDTAKSSHGACLLSLSRACQDLLAHFSRDHTPGSSGAKGWGQRSRSCLQ